MPTLQEQVNAATSGATIQHDTEFVGHLVINKPLTIQGVGVIRSPHVDPAIYIPPKTGPVVLRGKSVNEPLKVTHTGKIYDIIRWSDWQVAALADVPQGLTLEYVDVFGAVGQESQRGLAANGANLLIKDSKIRDIKGKGYDTQAVCAWNGPGPFKLIDSYFEASGENVLFGGADARIPNLIPSDIEMRRCHLFKPLSWRGQWTAKNLFELKNARRVIVDGCRMENSWGDAQIGFGVLFTVRNQDGTNPWAVIEDVQFTNTELLNCAGGFQLLGSDWIHPSRQSSRLRIANNVIRLAQNGELGPNGRLLQFDDSYHQVTFENNDADPPHSMLLLASGQSQGLAVRNNLIRYGQYGLFTTGDQPLTAMAPDVSVVGNYVYGAGIPVAKKIAGNSYFDTKPSSVPVGVGVDLTALRAAQAKPTTTPQPQPEPQPEPIPQPPPPPTASPDGTKATTITDASGGVWTLGPEKQTLRNNIHMAGGFGTIYKWLGGKVYVLGTNLWWYEFTGTAWRSISQLEPGTEPTTRILPWPKQAGQQNATLETQWAGKFRLKRIDGNSATFERVN